MHLRIISLRYNIAECRLSGSNGRGKRTILNIWTVASTDHTMDPKPSSLARWARSIRIQQNGACKGIGGVINEILVFMRQTH